MSTLSGKLALVTGGSRGIGAETARQLAAEGATVAISYNSSPDRAEAVVEEITAAGGKAKAFRSNAADASAPQRLIDEVTGEFGHLDILVNNAGVFIGGPIGEAGADSFADNFDVNVRGVYETTRVAVNKIKDGGRIINIGSFLGTKSMPGVSAYNATKAAVDSFSRTWAKELVGRKITVNTVSPGSINTEMNPGDAEVNPSADYQRTLNPMARYGKPADIAHAVVFLAGPNTDFITGINLLVDGGASA